MLNHVIVPLDGSTLAEEALEWAINILPPEGKITLVTAVDVPETAIYGPELVPVVRTSAPDYQKATESLLPQARKYLKHMAETLRERGLQVEIAAEIEDAATLIASFSAQPDVDIVVMSTHGRSGLRRIIYGSVTNEVLKRAACPVLVVPSQTE